MPCLPQQIRPYQHTQRVLRPVLEEGPRGRKGTPRNLARYLKIIIKDEQNFGKITDKEGRTLPASYGIRILFSVTVVLKSFLAVAMVLKSLTLVSYMVVSGATLGCSLKEKKQNPCHESPI